MKQIFAKLEVERGIFGSVKSFEKQHFDERLYRLMPDKSEYGDNEASVKDAFGTAINELFSVWNDKTRRSLVASTVRVLICFNSDYSLWKVEVDPYGCGTHLPTVHPDFNSFVEKEENKIFEKYEFKEEKKPPKKFAVAYRGRKTIMNEEQFDNFRKDIIEMYPRSWQWMYRAEEVDET